MIMDNEKPMSWYAIEDGIRFYFLTETRFQAVSMTIHWGHMDGMFGWCVIRQILIRYTIEQLCIFFEPNLRGDPAYDVNIIWKNKLLLNIYFQNLSKYLNFMSE